MFMELHKRSDRATPKWEKLRLERGYRCPPVSTPAMTGLSLRVCLKIGLVWDSGLAANAIHTSDVDT